ncbi:MAG: cysteine hydrolase [Ktedonobacteraceae bacterium]|nr:cysteine hydrolase [Ktedonobacteraceae bacterium]
MVDTNKTAHTALLIMDVQAGIADYFVKDSDILQRLGTAINAAHAAHIPVIYAVVTFRKDYPEISPDNKSFAGIKNYKSPSQETTAAALIHPAIAPQASDIVVTKRRISAFTGSDLDLILRSQGIRHLVLAGVATSGVVLSTLREAADKDYILTVLSDCCAEGDEEVQRVLLTKVFPRQADVITAEEWATTVA